MNTIPVIDYAKHPAFSSLDITSDPGDDILEQLMGIDASLLNAKNPLQFEKESTAKWEAIFQMLDNRVQDADLCERTKLSLANAAETMQAYCRWQHKPKQRLGKSKHPANTEKYLTDIHEDGGSVIQFPEEVLEKLRGMLAPEIQQTEARHKLKPTDRCSLHMRTRGEAYELAWKTLEQMGLIATLNEFFGRKVNPIYWYLAYNANTESWYKNCYGDVGLPTSDLAYSHFDHDFELAKIQIYLTDVTENDGPFAFVPGSHKWTGCKTQQFIFKEMDKAFKYPKDESLYYRPRFGSPQYRKQLLQLPTPLQGSSHFGDDLVNGSPMTEELKKQFRVVTSDQGNCCVFAGGDLLHYGGLCNGTDRWVIQFGLATEQPHSAGPEPKRSLLAKLATKSRKFVGDGTIDGIRKMLGYNDTPIPQANYSPTQK